MATIFQHILVFTLTSEDSDRATLCLTLAAAGTFLLLSPGLQIFLTDLNAELHGYVPPPGPPSLRRSKSTYRLFGALPIVAAIIFWFDVKK